MTDLLEARRQSHEFRRSTQYDVSINEQGTDLFMSPDDMMVMPQQQDMTFSEGLSALGDSLVDTGAATGRAVLGGVRDAGQGFLDLTGELADLLESQVPLGYITYGPEGLGWQQEKPEGYTGPQLPEVPRGDSVVENIGRGLVQFAAGFTAAPVRGAGMVANMARGGFADALFNPEDGNLSTFLKEVGLDNDVINYLDSQVGEEAGAEERLRARMKNTLEGMGLGALIDTTMAGFKAARSDEGIKGTIRNGLINAGDRAQARLDEAGSGTTLTSGVDPTGAVDSAIAAVGRLVAKPEERAVFEMAPPDQRAHKSPPQLLVTGNGEKATLPVTQAYNANNRLTNFQNIDNLLEQHPDALKSAENWLAMEQSAMGGQYLPIPPMQAIRYSSDVNLMAEKLRKLTPELKAGVDEGFNYVKQIRGIYQSGAADPKMTADMFVWGILSRGAGPVQQEAAFLDIMEQAQPMMQKVVDGTFSEADAKEWTSNMSKIIPEGSPGKQVTMNVNAAGKLLFELAKKPEGSDQTVLQTLHEMVADESIPAKMIRRKFMELTDSAGIDNKVVSFILLVAGRDDVLVMDRIQGRHLWDDGRFEGKNIYDGFYKEGTTVQEGLLGIFKGPRGILVTEMLEDGMRPNVEEAYRMVGRAEDASLGRFHWETWVIEGEQVVSHSTLDSIAKNNPIGGSVKEGKTDEFASGFRYIRGAEGPVQEYPLSTGEQVYMTPTRAKEFLAYIKKPKSGIVPTGFKVTERADIPWYERAEVNREALDKAARDYANSNADGAVLSGSAGADTSQNTAGRGGRKRGLDASASDGGD